MLLPRKTTNGPVRKGRRLKKQSLSRRMLGPYKKHLQALVRHLQALVNLLLQTWKNHNLRDELKMFLRTTTVVHKYLLLLVGTAAGAALVMLVGIAAGGMAGAAIAKKLVTPWIVNVGFVGLTILLGKIAILVGTYLRSIASIFDLKGRKVIEQWAVLLEGCAGEGEGLLEGIASLLIIGEVPDTTWSRKSVSPSFLKRLFGKRRDFLIVRYRRFREYILCINVRDFGRHLDVSWYLVARPGFFRRLLGLPVKLFIILTRGETPEGMFFRKLDLFDQQDIRTLVTVTHRSVKGAVDELARKRELDGAALHPQTNGILGIR